nr:Signal recognition particle receptor protein FtsY [Raoultella sp. NCTC 9187]
MAKEKKRGFFSWLGFGQKEQAQETEVEQKVEGLQEAAEQAPAEQAPAETVVAPEAEADRAPALEKADPEAFAADVVEVTEQVVESEQPQPVAETIVEEAVQPLPAIDAAPTVDVAKEAAVEELAAEPAVVEPQVRQAVVDETPVEEPLVEEVIAEPAVAEALAEQEPEEAIAEPQAVVVEDTLIEDAPALSDDELEAQALAAEVEAETEEESEPQEAAQIEQEKPTKEGFFARLKRSLVKTKQNLGSGFISLFRGKKIDDDLFEELEEQLLIADVGVETTRKIITHLTGRCQPQAAPRCRSAVWPAERGDGRYSG